MARDIDHVMKCKECGADIVKIGTSNGRMVCNAHPVAYWRSSYPNTSILTPNGETIYCVLKGKLGKMYGLGYTLHTCFQIPEKEVLHYG